MLLKGYNDWIAPERFEKYHPKVNAALQKLYSQILDEDTKRLTARLDECFEREQPFIRSKCDEICKKIQGLGSRIVKTYLEKIKDEIAQNSAKIKSPAFDAMYDQMIQSATEEIKAFVSSTCANVAIDPIVKNIIPKLERVIKAFRSDRLSEIKRSEIIEKIRRINNNIIRKYQKEIDLLNSGSIGFEQKTFEERYDQMIKKYDDELNHALTELSKTENIQTNQLELMHDQIDKFGDFIKGNREANFKLYKFNKARLAKRSKQHGS